MILEVRTLDAEAPPLGDIELATEVVAELPAGAAAANAHSAATPVMSAKKRMVLPRSGVVGD